MVLNVNNNYNIMSGVKDKNLVKLTELHNGEHVQETTTTLGSIYDV